MCSSSFCIEQFLTIPQKSILNSIDSKELRSSILAYLDQSNLKNISLIIQPVLKLISQIPQSRERDRFFTHFLSERTKEVPVLLEKINALVVRGVFNEFLQKIHTEKRVYHNQKKISEMIDLFSSAPLTVEPLSHHHRPIDSESASSEEVEGSAITSKIESFITDHLEENIILSYFERSLLSKVFIKMISPINVTIDLTVLKNHIQTLISLAIQIKKNIGEEILKEVCRAFLRKSELSRDDLKGAMLLIIKSSSHKKTFYASMNAWRNFSYSWDQLTILFTPHITEEESDPHFTEDLETKLSRFRQDSTIQVPLKEDQIEQIRSQFLVVEHYCDTYRSMTFHELIAIAHHIRNQVNQNQYVLEDRYKLIALGRLAIKIHFGIYAYNTQILAILGVLLDNKSRQAQVKTGEGKSTIIALWAFVMAMECQSVDIITSARSLAIRDQQKYFEFYKRCDITSSHICYDEKKHEHFNAQILYGPAFDFEFALMEDLLYNSKLFLARLNQPFLKKNFDRVCVDESDNLLIDTAGNGALLGMTSDSSFEWVYAPILIYVRQTFDSNHLRGVTTTDVMTVRQRLIAVSSQEKVDQIKDADLKTWIESAYIALFKKNPDIDYVVKKYYRKGILKRSIHIVDIQTGRISENSRWKAGIHEFLEVKHDIAVKKETILPISLNHSVFYQKYQSVTALTGTAERHQTKEIYSIDSFDVPPHKPLMRIDLSPIIVNSQEVHTSAVLNMINEKRHEERPVLVLCRTIQDSKQLSSRLRSLNIPHKLLNEVQEEEEESIIREAGGPGKVTIATNTAGRGTDIILHPDCLQPGKGLHVLLTFYPDTEREYYQAVGRAGRQGQPGTSQMVLCKDSESKYWLNTEAIIPNDSFLELLNFARIRRQFKSETRHANLAQVERHIYKKLETFYQQFRDWEDSVACNDMYDYLTGLVSTFKTTAEKVFDFSQLSEHDLKLAKIGKNLMSVGYVCQPLEWKHYIQDVVKRIKHKVLIGWSLNFYEPATEATREILDDLDTKKAEIDAIYEEHKELWEKYLRKDGSGVFVYLNEIFSINFLMIFERLGRWKII